MLSGLTLSFLSLHEGVNSTSELIRCDLRESQGLGFQKAGSV